MKMKILSCVLINCLFMLSNTFGSGVYITPNCASVNRDAVLSCIDKNTCKVLLGCHRIVHLLVFRGNVILSLVFLNI